MRINTSLSGPVEQFENFTVALTDLPHSRHTLGLVQNLLQMQQPDGIWLPTQGDPNRRPDDRYDQIYYTFHAISALLDAGFDLNFRPISAGLQAIASKFDGVSVNYRPIYFLLMPLRLLPEEDVAGFVERLSSHQIGPGSPFSGAFLLPQGWLDEEQEVTQQHWDPNYHVGGAYFHALHHGFLLREILRVGYTMAEAQDDENVNSHHLW